MLHVKIDNLNVSLVGFCFIRSIDPTVLPFQKKTGNEKTKDSHRTSIDDGRKKICHG
jgi:hypothetical protein